MADEEKEDFLVQSCIQAEIIFYACSTGAYQELQQIRMASQAGWQNYLMNTK